MPLILIMVAIIAVLTLVMPPRIYGDWLKCAHYSAEGEQELLKALLRAENQWMLRHLVCAAAATALVAAIKLNPSLHQYDTLSHVTIIYALMSLSFAAAESLLAGRISRAVATAA